MNRIIAAMAAVTLSTSGAFAQSIELQYEVERVEKEEASGIARALLKVNNRTDSKLSVAAQCTFVDRDLKALGAGSGAILVILPESQGHVQVQANLSPEALQNYSNVTCAVIGSKI